MTNKNSINKRVTDLPTLGTPTPLNLHQLSNQMHVLNNMF
jgi:hypothetical protein